MVRSREISGWEKDDPGFINDRRDFSERSIL